MVPPKITACRPHWTRHPLVRALVLSLVVHVGLFGTLQYGTGWDFWRHSPWVVLAKALGLDRLVRLSPRLAQALTPAKPAEPRKPDEAREYPLLFVDVDPSQATTEAPAKTPYYSPFNSLAANPDTHKETGVPKLDGTQDRVLKTKDTLRANPAALPPQPALPQEPQEGAETESAPVPALAAQSPKPVSPPAPKPGGEPETKPGDTLMAKVSPVASPEPSTAEAPQPESAPPARKHYRRLAEAMAAKQLNPYSAMVGEKMKQEGGVQRFSVSSSLDVRGSKLGSYDAKFVQAVQQCWFTLLDEQRYSLDRLGKVVLDFRLTSDGRITDMKVVDSDVGEIYTTICELAIRKPSPYEKWPMDLRKLIGGDHRDVRFTFYY